MPVLPYAISRYVPPIALVLLYDTHVPVAPASVSSKSFPSYSSLTASATIEPVEYVRSDNSMRAGWPVVNLKRPRVFQES